MKMEAVDLVLPELLITNDEVLDRIKFHSKEEFAGDIRNLMHLVNKLFEKSGANTRYWSGSGSKPINYVVEAAAKALAKANMTKGEIDLVIFVGVDRGFYEPANAYFVADSLKCHAAQCFDIVDACNGWSRALQICNSFFQSGCYRNALIVNGEFPMFAGGPIYPELFKVKSLDQLRHRFAAFTLGEGASATVLTAQEDPNWEYKSLSCPRFADLCTISCHDGGRYARHSDLLDVDGAGHFVSFGEQMLELGQEHAISVLRSLSIPVQSIKAILPHTISQHAIRAAASSLGASDLIYSVFPKVGNLISASIPAGIMLARDEGRIQADDIVTGWVGSAGMVFSAYTFTA